jgi:hypothetical protein
MNSRPKIHDQDYLPGRTTQPTRLGADAKSVSFDRTRGVDDKVDQGHAVDLGAEVVGWWRE